MAHNWVLLAKEAYAPRFIEAGISHPERDFIAFEQEFYVLAKTRMLGPGESDSVTFTAPRDPGAYEYVCTFPEHYAGGMKGVMTSSSISDARLVKISEPFPFVRDNL